MAVSRWRQVYSFNDAVSSREPALEPVRFQQIRPGETLEDCGIDLRRDKRERQRARRIKTAAHHPRSSDWRSVGQTLGMRWGRKAPTPARGGRHEIEEYSGRIVLGSIAGAYQLRGKWFYAIIAVTTTTTTAHASDVAGDHFNLPKYCRCRRSELHADGQWKWLLIPASWILIAGLTRAMGRCAHL